MNKQRKVVITTTYNEMGIIIDTKAEEVARPNLQPTCNGLATDCISRLAAIDAIDKALSRTFTEPCGEMILKDVPSIQQEPEHTMEEFMYGQDLGSPEDGSL